MKKMMFLGFIAFTALSVTSCSNDEVMEAVPQKQAIEFGTYLGRDAQARGTITSDGDLADFGVFAYYTGQNDWGDVDATDYPNGYGTDVATPNFMFDQKVARNTTSGVGTYSPIKYWPETKNDKISFFAYGPYTNYEATPAKTVSTVANANQTTGAPTVTFTQSGDVTKMVDFVAGVKMDEIGSGDTYATTTPSAVNFILKHELTRLNFVAKMAASAFGESAYDGHTKINITDVVVEAGGSFYKSNDYTFDTKEDDNTVAPAVFYKGTWGNSPTSTTADLNVTPIVNTVAANIGSYTTSGVLLTQDNGEVSLFKTDQYLFLIPVASYAATGTDVVNVTFKYDIVTYDEALDGKYSLTTATKTVTLPAGTLAQGKAYKYTFTFGLHEVKVTAAVTSWEAEGAGGNADVDWTDTDATID